MFPISRWRRAVAAAATQVGSGAIAPFGFELTQSPAYLSFRLRYLFVYVARTQPPCPPERMAGVLLRSVQEAAPAVRDSIERVDCDGVAVRTGTPGAWRTVVVRTVAAPPRAMARVWARYVVATALHANRGRIKAVTEYHADLMSQRYLCQLATMHDALFCSLSGAPALDLRQAIAARLRTLQSISLDMRYRPDLLNQDEAGELHRGITAYYAALDGWLDVADVRVRARVPDFHGPNRLELPAHPALARLVETAVRRYRGYPALAAAPRRAMLVS